MKVTICMPILRTIQAETFVSILNLRLPPGTEYAIEIGSVVYDARNKLALKAIENGSDYILWVDADMTFGSEALNILLEDAKEGKEYISGMFFTRGFPIKPVVHKEIIYKKGEDNIIEHAALPFYDYPKDKTFEIGGSGFGFVLTSVDLIKRLSEHFEMSPFEPLPYLGEDYSFCHRTAEMGVKMYCDSRVQCGHVGNLIYSEQLYRRE